MKSADWPVALVALILASIQAELKAGGCIRGVEIVALGKPQTYIEYNLIAQVGLILSVAELSGVVQIRTTRAKELMFLRSWKMWESLIGLALLNVVIQIIAFVLVLTADSHPRGVAVLSTVAMIVLSGALAFAAWSGFSSVGGAIEFLAAVGISVFASIFGTITTLSMRSVSYNPLAWSTGFWRSIFRVLRPRERTATWLGDDSGEIIENNIVRGSSSSSVSVTPMGRVLNAKFAKVTGEQVDQREWLISDTAYDLLVDIGPKWIDSIVSGFVTFPEKSLPPNLDGHRILVVFVCEGLGLGSDGKQHIYSKFILLPRGTGQSRPIIDGVTAEQAGPIAIRFRTPRMRLGTGAELPEPPREIHGRLCLYWENNLLQSAVVKVEVSPPQRSLFRTRPEDWYSFRTLHEIHVDYVLTQDFDAFDDLRTRAVKSIAADIASKGEAIALNITLNDDTAGGHRIIVPSLGEPIFFHYDPKGVEKLLADARKFLMECYWRKDANGNVILQDEKPILDLDRDNGRNIEAFKRDLFELAKFGSKLFEIIFLHAASSEGASSLQRIKQLQRLLVETTTIQVARTAPATYAFPWDLVYDYPLFQRAKYALCPVIDEEWGTLGRRTAPVARKCPHHEEHPSNVICPYGFWGLRHRIEQPPSLPRDDHEKTVNPKEPARWAAPTPFYAAFTSDAMLDQALIKKHVSALKGIAKLKFEPPPVIDWEGVQVSLKSPKIVYFLCHGEYDAERKEPYLGVGLRDGNYQHRVYVSDLSGFFLALPESDADAWAQNRPLIIINGCHTTDLRPGDLLNFVSAFAAAGAGGIIGTEISVVIEVAIPVGEMLLSSFTAGEAVADAIHSMRWQLVNRGNLLGLTYTPYCMADLKIGQATSS
jgi:hypothetical protein